MKKSKTNKAWKRAAAGALSVALVAGTLPANVGGFLTESNGNSFVAFAEGETSAVEVDFTEVNSFDALATAISEGKNPKLTADVSLSSVLTIAENADITLDLNGHTITHTAADQVVINGKFTVIDSTATAQANDNNALYSANGKIVVGGFAGFKINDGGTMIVNSGHINKTADGSYLIHDKRSAGSTAKFIINDGFIDMLSTVNNSMIALCGTIEVHGGVLRNQSQALKGEETSTVIIDGGLIESTSNVDNVPTMYSYGTTTISGGTFRSSNEGLNTCIWVLTYKGYESTTTITGGSIDNIEVSQSNSAGTTTKGNLVVSGTPTIGTIYLGGTSKLNNVENDVFAGNVTISGGTIGSIEQYKANSFDSLNITGGTIRSIDLKNANNVTIADTVNIPSWKIADSTSLAKAFAAASANGTNIELTDNITLTAQQDVLGGKKITLDLKGKTINANDSRAIWVKNGDLSITGTGTISSYKTTEGSAFTKDSSVIRVCDANAVDNGSAKLTVGENVTVYSDICFGITVFGKVPGTLDFYGTVEVTGSEAAISGNGTKGLSPTTINIHPSATVTATQDVAIYHPQAGTLNITGGTIEGLGGIEAKAGTVNVSGAAITATGGEEHEANGNGSSSKGYAISAVDNNGYAGPATFNISGGTITGPVAILNDNGNGNGTISITGGTFSTSLAAAYIADGYLQNSNGQVVANTDFEYVISKNGTITLDKDTTYGNISVAEGVTATIDLNGHNLNLAASEGGVRSFMVNKNANLTVMNSSNTAATVNAAAQSTVDDGATFTVDEGVTLTSAAQYTLYYKANSTVNVAGTVANTHLSDGTAISGNHDRSAGSTLNISGSVTTENGNAIYHPQDGTLNITSGTVSGKTAIYARTGNINISGGTLTANGEVKTASEVANGADPTGDALALQVYTASYGAAPVVNVTGGTFTSENGKPIATYWAKAADELQVPTKFVKGGTYNNELDNALIADGYVQSQDGDNFKVEKPSAENIRTISVNAIDINGNATAQTVYYNDSEVLGNYELPKAPYLDGYEFSGYYVYSGNTYTQYDVKSANEVDGVVNNLISSYDNNVVNIRVAYTKKVDYCTVSVTNGQIVGAGETEKTSKTFNVSDVVTVKALDDTNQHFSHWVKKGSATSADVIVSCNQSYTFIVPEGGITLEAVYVANISDVQAEPTGFIESVKKPASNQISFVSVLNVPDGCQMLKAGVVARANGAYTGKLTTANAKYVKYSDTSKNSYKTFKYTWTMTTSNSTKVWDVRPYLEYKDKNGVIQTIYGAVESKSINQV